MTMSEYVELIDEDHHSSRVLDKKKIHPQTLAHFHSFSVQPKNSIEILVEKEQQKLQRRIKGTYIGRCVILFPIANLNAHNFGDSMWEHNVKKIMHVSTMSVKSANHQKIWKNIKNIQVEHVQLTQKNTESFSEREKIKATKPFALCLMDVIEYVAKCNDIKENDDLRFELAGIQNKAQEYIEIIIKGNFNICPNDEKEIDKFVCFQIHELDDYKKHPDTDSSKLLLVCRELFCGNAAFIAIGYRMLVYQESLQQSYAVFRHYVDHEPKLCKSQVYVLQSLDYARFQYVSVSEDVVCYNFLQQSLFDNGLL